MTQTRAAMFVTVLLVGGIFAGCIGGKDEPVDPHQGTGGEDISATKPEGQQEQLGWIYGSVSDLATEAPVAGVNVSLGAGLGFAITGDDGRFVIINIPRGEYILTARAEQGYLLSRYAISVFADEGTRMDFKLQPTSGAGIEDLTPVVYTNYFFKETSGADYTVARPGALSIEAPSGAEVQNDAKHPLSGGYGVSSSPADGVLGGRNAAQMSWEIQFDESTTLHADVENPVEFEDPSYPGDGVNLVRYTAMKVKIWKWAVDGLFIPSVRIEDVAPDGSTELLALRIARGGSNLEDGAVDGAPGLVEMDMPFLKRGKEFHTFQAGHKLRVTFEDSAAHWVVYWFDGEQFPAGIDLRKGPYLEPPKAGDRMVIQFKGHTAAGASNPYGIAWFVPVPPEADPALALVPGVHRTGAGGYYVATACPDNTSSTCVGDTTVFFDVPQGAQTVYTRLEFTAPPVRDPSALFNDYDILLYEPSGKAHTHTAGYGANQAELQFHDVFETPEWPQKWWVEIFSFLVVSSDWVCTIEIQF